MIDYDNDVRTCTMESLKVSIQKAQRKATRICKKYGKPESTEAALEVCRLQGWYIKRLEAGDRPAKSSKKKEAA